MFFGGTIFQWSLSSYSIQIFHDTMGTPVFYMGNKSFPWRQAQANETSFYQIAYHISLAWNDRCRCKTVAWCRIYSFFNACWMISACSHDLTSCFAKCILRSWKVENFWPCRDSNCRPPGPCKIERLIIYFLLRAAEFKTSVHIIAIWK